MSMPDWLGPTLGIVGMLGGALGLSKDFDLSKVRSQFGSKNDPDSALGSLQALQGRANQYQDLSSNIYGQGRRMLQNQSSKQNALNQMMMLRNMRSQGMGQFGGYSPTAARAVTDMGQRASGEAMDKMLNMYVSGQGTADSLLSNVASGRSQIANALAGYEFEAQKADKAQYNDFLSATMGGMADIFG